MGIFFVKGALVHTLPADPPPLTVLYPAPTTRCCQLPGPVRGAPLMYRPATGAGRQGAMIKFWANKVRIAILGSGPCKRLTCHCHVLQPLM